MNNFEREIHGVGWMSEKPVTLSDILYGALAIIGIIAVTYGLLLIAAADYASH